MRKILLLTVPFFFCVLLIYAEGSEPAVLARGPVEHDGIEFLGINTIPSKYGEYHYQDDEIIIYYTTEQVFLSGEWVPSDCNAVDAFRKDIADSRRVIAYTDKKGWTAFLSFKADSDYICSFLSIYKSRQNYFLNIARDKSVFSFPAILEF